MVRQVKDTVLTTALVSEEVLRADRQAGERVWSPHRSKLGAAIRKGYVLPDLKGKHVLYLGAAHGYTPSFISDEIGKKGIIICLEKSKIAMRKLLLVCESRENMAPLLADANHPEKYPEDLPSFDVLYQDVAQKNQAQIFLKNFALIKKGGLGFFAIKAKPIDTVAPAKVTIEKARSEIAKHHEILAFVDLEPYEHDHALLVVRKA